MPELLLEVGCEEMPAWALRRAAGDLGAAITSQLREARVEPGEPHVYSTPRRLIVAFADVPETRAAAATRARGPSIQAAYGPDGTPTKALEGFCRSKGVNPASVEGDGEYVWAVVEEPGGPTAELLPGVFERSLATLEFAKAMRWGSNRTRFVRPVRWIVAAFGGAAVPFEFAGVRSGLLSRGHRFRAGEAFEASTLARLLAGLRERHVEPDPQARSARIREGLAQLGAASFDEALVAENADLTEWPECHTGEFREEYLGLPAEVLATVIAKHERMFLVAGPGGSPTRRFVAVRNGGEEEAVRRGNEWVVNARLEDARFFWLEDAKRSMAEFLEATARIAFHAELGTVRQRAERLAALARAVARASGAGEDEEAWAEEAGRMAKADLATGLVGELDELQGTVGGIYLSREGRPGPVCQGVSGHYSLPVAASSAGARTALRVLAADQLDKLVGYLGVGAEPKGSRDPFGLRRAAGLLVEAAWALPTLAGGYGPLIKEAEGLYRGQGFLEAAPGTEGRLEPLFRQRYETLLGDARPDVVAAASVGPLDPRGVRFRSEALARLALEPGLVQQASRPANIVAAARAKGFEIAAGKPDPAVLGSAEGEALWDECERQAPLAHQAAQAESADALLAALRPLGPPIDRYFETTMVMHDDPAVRAQRLAVAEAAAALWRLAGDLGQLVFEG